MAITLVTGALWGRITWGAYWVWDARLTTTAFLFVSYIGYLAVRGLGGSHQQRAKRRRSSRLLVVLEIPLVHFTVEAVASVHQDASVAGRTATSDRRADAVQPAPRRRRLLAALRLVLLHRQRVMYLRGRDRRPGPRPCARPNAAAKRKAVERMDDRRQLRPMDEPVILAALRPLAVSARWWAFVRHVERQRRSAPQV